MRCHNCPKNAMFEVGPAEGRISLCLDCYIRFQNVIDQQLEDHERHINFLTAQMESVVGFPGILPRYPERRGRVIHTGALTLNNIHVSNSNVGVINTGTLQNVDATVTVLKSEGNAELANSIAALAQAVIELHDVADSTKNQVLEILGALSQEAVVPKDKRKTGVMRALISELSNLLGSVAALAALWAKAKALFEQLFS